RLDPRTSIVAIEPVAGDVHRAVRAALDAVGFREVLPRGGPVSLKVNLGWDLFIPGSITSPLVVEALIRALSDHVGEIFIVEADQVLEDVERAYRDSGMAERCERLGARWVNMTREPTVTVEDRDNVILRRIDVPRILTRTSLVTVPVMKTHAKTWITGALKNQWGCLPTMRHEYHLVLDDALADLNHVVRPVLALMDGTVGLEGNGPKSGWPRVADRILCSTDPVALDTIQAICMGLDPARAEHIARCAARGIGICARDAIETRGLIPERSVVEFRPPRHNAVSRVENLLRRSWLKRLVFDTPIFRVCLSGAKLYYRVWTARRAGAAWRTVVDHPVYGAQWRAVLARRGGSG
ncbi:MAG TPA: DUF362 domain-containing protein, partial [Candidatus Polarisedimenticolaceae bacterium]|nr:DUF362 domain-containing protein [Candidatus Polarisedimenticolaceae bacterium]